MFCKSCGNKLTKEDCFCKICRAKKIGESNSLIISNKKERDNTKIAVISGVLFLSSIVLTIIATTLAVIFESEGLFFLILMPVVPMGIGSILFAIISFYNFIKDKKNNLKISKIRFVFTIINIIELGFAFYIKIIQPIIYNLIH